LLFEFECKKILEMNVSKKKQNIFVVAQRFLFKVVEGGIRMHLVLTTVVVHRIRIRVNLLKLIHHIHSSYANTLLSGYAIYQR
jgi:hypothetical protein